MAVPPFDKMQSMPGSEHQMSQESSPLTPRALWSVDLKLIHLDWNPEATLIHFQGQYLTICELDYNILQGEIQNIPKSKAAVEIGEFCLVEDATSARWFRGRVQNQKDAVYDVFLIDHGNVLSVDISHISSCSNSLFNLPPKIVCGFLSNVLLLQNVSHPTVEKYFSSLIGKNITGIIQALLPHKVLLLEAPNINYDLVWNGLGRLVDTDTFILLVSMLTEVPLKQNIEPVPDLLIEKPRVQEFCFKSFTLQGYEEILSLCGPRLTCELHAKVRVTAAVSPMLFYCQLANKEKELCQMSRRLALIFEHRTKEYNQKTPENLGLLCAIKGKDRTWYRGLVQFLPVNSQVRVFFIDCGFFEFVKVENVHRLPPEFYSVPVMALPCSLPAKIGQDGALKAQQLGFLKTGLLGAVLDVEIGEFDVEQHLYTITVLGAAETHVEGPVPVQNRPTESDVKNLRSEEGYLNCETIVGEVFSKTLQAEEVQVGSVFVGYVEHAQNPNHFWVRTQKRNEEFEKMMLKITDHFSQVKLDEDLLNVDIGTMCCAIYEEDMHFYRGVVIDILKHGAEILFIDFGNIEKVPHALIKNMPESAVGNPAFAICCTLANIFPLDDVWPSATCDFFRKAVLNKVLQVRVLQIKKQKCVVELLEMESDYSIAKLLTSSKLAEYISVKPAKQNGKDGPDKTKHCSETAKTCGKSEQWGEEEENTCINEKKAKVGFGASSIKPGLEFSVRCSDITSPSDFWCQLLDKVPILDTLVDEMQHYYSVHTGPLQPGESLCVAKSPHDGKWYRGVVVGRQKDQSTVMLVDYGRIVQIREQHLQAVAQQFVNLEEQAFRCSLNNLTESADPAHCEDWSPEDSDVLKEFVIKSANDLKCKVVSQSHVKNKGLSNVVELYNSQQSVTDALIEERLARRATTLARQKSDVLPESFVYSSFDLHPGSEEKVYVTHVSSQCEFYCQLERNTEIIEELEKKISEESEKLMKANTTAVVGNLCLAKYLDGKWYRALMLPVQSQLHFDVFFVDYGNTNISEKTKVFFIPRNCEDLLYTPMQAVRCHLDLVPKAELFADVKKWLCNAVINQLVRIVIQSKRDDGSFDVELFDGEVNVNEKVKELILSLSQTQKTECLTQNRNKMKNKTHHKKNTKSLVNWKSLSKGQSSASISNVRKSKNTKNRDRSSQNKNTTTKQNESERWEMSQTKSKVQQRDYEDVKSNQTQQSGETKTPQLCVLQKSIRPGFRTKCFVSHIDSISSFFLQLSGDEPDILKMGEDLNTSLLRDSLKMAASFQLGDVVLAEFEEDGALYRSVVKTQENSLCFKVEFVDYGNIAVVRREKMYPIPEEYLSQPRFSIPCSLLDTSSYEMDSSFTDAVVEKPLMVDFIHQYGIQWKVKVEVLDVVIATQDSSLKESLLNETSENVTSCEQNLREKDQQNDDSAVEGGNLMAEPSPVRSIIALRCLKKRRFRRSGLKKTKTSSAKAKKDCKDIALPTIQPRDTETGTILSVRSDGSFYIRLTKNNNLLRGLEKHIKNHINECKTVSKVYVKEGLRCLVPVEDKWERAVVQQVSQGEFKVFLVDSGITKDIQSVAVLELGFRLSELPNLAVLCKMNSLGFTREEEANQCWYKTLEPMIGSEVKLIFVSFSEAENSWMVEIVMDGRFLLRQIKASCQQNLEKSASSATSGPTSDPTTPQQLVFAPVETDKDYSGFAAVVTTPSDFCVILEDLLLVMNKVSVALDDLPQEMPPLPEAHVGAGTCCLFKSESQNKWYRAEIIHANASVVLDLVDYGQYECISYHNLSKLKKLPAELTDLPKVTFPCTLRGVRPVGDGQWSDKAASFFQKSLYQKKLQIIFREFVSNSDWNVDVKVDGVHVAKTLVDAGHADYTDATLQLRFQATGHPPGSDGAEEEASNEAEAVGEPDAKQMFGAEPSSKPCFLM